MPFVVPVSPCPLLTDPPFVCGVLFLSTALGRRVLNGLRVPLADISALEHGLISVTLGIGLLQFVPFSLGMAHLLTPMALWISLAFLALLLSRDMVAVARRMLQAARNRVWPGEGFDRALLCCLGVVLALRLIHTLCPTTDPDSLIYHLAAPKRWLQTGSLGYLPGMIFLTNSFMGLEMIYTLALGVWSDTAAKLFHFAIGLLALGAIVALGQRLSTFRVGLVSAAVFLLLPKFGAASLFSIAYVDLGPVLAMLCALLAWLQWKNSDNRGWLACAALCTGFSVSFKLMTGTYLVTLAALTFFRQRRIGGSAVAARQGAMFLCVSLLPVLPWLGRSWLITGNPIYPFLPRLFPTPDWSLAENARLTHFMRYYVWFSERVAMSLHSRQIIYAATLILTAALLALLWQCWRGKTQRLLLACFGPFLLVQLLVTGPYVRYLLPIVPLVMIASLLGIQARLATSRALYVGVLVLLLCFALVEVRYDLKGIPNEQPGLPYALSTAMGRVSRQDYLDRYHGLMPLWNYINAHAEADTHVLCSGFLACYYADPYAYSTEPLHQWHIRCDTWDHFASDVKRDHITYLIAPQETEQSSGNVTVEQIANGRELWDNERLFVHRLASLNGQAVAQTENETLYALRPL